jgi:hypothetical protein
LPWRVLVTATCWRFGDQTGSASIALPVVSCSGAAGEPGVIR